MAGKFDISILAYLIILCFLPGCKAEENRIDRLIGAVTNYATGISECKTEGELFRMAHSQSEELKSFVGDTTSVSETDLLKIKKSLIATVEQTFDVYSFVKGGPKLKSDEIRPAIIKRCDRLLDKCRTVGEIAESLTEEYSIEDSDIKN